ncbi:MAG: hypothetical protein V1926_00335 [Candidatus Peregrinibacteria bacterium]
MRNIFTLIGLSWDFARKQPVLVPVAVWFFTLPIAGLMGLAWFESENPVLRAVTENGIGPATDLRLVSLVLLAEIILSLLIVWGISCVLLVGKRMIGNRAGRTKTSFHAVRTEAGRFVLPLIFTSVLRSCFTILWGILFIVPGIVYSIRTVLYPVTVIEGGSPRRALKSSREVVKGRTTTVFVLLALVALMFFLPTLVIAGIIETAATLLHPALAAFTPLVSAALFTVPCVLFLLTMVALYGELKKHPVGSV